VFPILCSVRWFCSSALDAAFSAVEGDGATKEEILKCQAVCLTNRAAAQKMLNRLPQAIEDCRAAMARDSGHVKAYIRATKYHLQRVETDQAQECLSGLSRDLLNADDAAEVKSAEAEMRDICAAVGKLEEVI
jgi:tetratricopeptide (TPR) repeat protein